MSGDIMRRRSLNNLVLTALCLLTPAAAQALSSDRTHPIDIHADRVTIQEKSGYSDYRGHVEMTQGSMKLTADRVLIYQRDGRLQKVQASGEPAHFSQLPDGRTTRVQAEAHEMEYDATTGKLVLTGQARVLDGANSFAGERIDYDTRNATVSASKGAGGQGRVHAIIEPPGADTDSTPGPAEASPKAGPDKAPSPQQDKSP